MSRIRSRPENAVSNVGSLLALLSYPVLVEPVARDAAGRPAGDDRLGTGLQDVELTVGPVPAPLDVHGPAVVALDQQRVARQLLDILRAQDLDQGPEVALIRVLVERPLPLARATYWSFSES